MKDPIISRTTTTLSQSLLPAALQDGNPLGIRRLVEGVLDRH
ncbi:MAG: hypothetical protein ACO37F_01840 [Pirellulales bacterium]